MKILGGVIVAVLAAAFLLLAMPANAGTTYVPTASSEYQRLDARDLPALPGVKLGRWTGCHVGVHAGWSLSGTRGKIETAAGPVPGLDIEKDREDAAIGGVNAGCDMQMSRVVFGFAGDWTAGSAGIAHAISAGGVPMAVADFDVRDSYAFIGRVGFLVHDSLLVYALGGHTWANTGGLSIETAGGSAKFAMPDMAGWTVGAGAEFQPAALKGFSLKIEYRFTDFERERVDLMPAVSFGNDHVDHAVRVGLSYRFGAGE